MTEFKTYQIGEKTYEQRPLVLGQWQQLVPLLEGVTIPADGDAMEAIAMFGERLPKILAIVLVEQGTSPRGRDIDALADELWFSIDAEKALAVVADFFTCNPVPSLLARLTGMMQSLTGRVSTGSQSSA